MFKELVEQYKDQDFPADDIFKNILIRRYSTSERDAIRLINIIKDAKNKLFGGHENVVDKDGAKSGKQGVPLGSEKLRHHLQSNLTARIRLMRRCILLLRIWASLKHCLNAHYPLRIGQRLGKE